MNARMQTFDWNTSDLLATKGFSHYAWSCTVKYYLAMLVSLPIVVNQANPLNPCNLFVNVKIQFKNGFYCCYYNW